MIKKSTKITFRIGLIALAIAVCFLIVHAVTPMEGTTWNLGFAVYIGLISAAIFAIALFMAIIDWGQEPTKPQEGESGMMKSTKKIIRIGFIVLVALWYCIASL